MIRPLKPDDLCKDSAEWQWDAAYDTFNELITRWWDGVSVLVGFKEAEFAIASRLGWRPEAVRKVGLTSVQAEYAKAGWEVTVEKAGLRFTRKK